MKNSHPIDLLPSPSSRTHQSTSATVHISLAYTDTNNINYTKKQSIYLDCKMVGRLGGSEDQITELTYKPTRELHALLTLQTTYQVGEAQQWWAEPANGANRFFFFTFGSTNKNEEPSLIPFSILSLQLFTLDKR